MNQSWPNFFIVGAAKAGTTSLYKYLQHHPHVFMSPLKEPHYFSEIAPLNPEMGWSAPSVHDEVSYLTLFKEAAGYKAIGEASTSYLWSLVAPQRIYQKLPDAKIIVLLRNPIERAFSHYLMDVRANWQSLSFYEALREDFERADKGWHVSHLYVELGCYAAQLRRYWEQFGRENVLVLFFDELSHDTQAVLQKTAVFLQIDPVPFATSDLSQQHNPYLEFTPSLKLLHRLTPLRHLIQRIVPTPLRAQLRNRFFLKQSDKPTPEAKAVAYLKDIYAPEVDALAQLLNQPELPTRWQVAP